MNYTELFDYFKSERTRIVESFEKLPYEELEKNRELSFYSIKDVFLHTIDVEDAWLHYRRLGKPEHGFHPERFHGLAEIKDYISEVDAKTNALLPALTEEDLKLDVHRKHSDGRETVYPLKDVLYHIPIEVIHHYGEIFAEFWKMNLDAPYLSYLKYSQARSKT